MWKYPREVVRALIRSLFWWFFGIIMGFLMKDIIDWLISWFSLYDLWQPLLVIILLHAFKDLFGHFFRNNQLQLKNHIQKDLNATYMQKFLQADITTTELLWTWITNSLLQKWCDNRTGFIDGLFKSFIPQVVSIILWVIIIWWYFWRMWILTSIIISVIVIFLTNKSKKMVYPRRVKKKEIFTQTDRHVVKSIMSKQELLQNNKMNHEIWIQNNYFQDVGLVMNKESKWMIWFYDAPRSVTSILRVGIILYSIRSINEWLMTIWTFTLLWMVSWQIANELMNFTEWQLTVHQQLIHIEKLHDTFDMMPPLVGYETGELFQLKQWAITLNNISFTYQKKEEWGGNTNGIFDNLSLTIPAKQKIAFVGPSGGGKTTLVKLIAGYLRPTSGQILVDDQDLTTVSLKSYYPHIGYLTQDSSVFDWTIRENLEYWITAQTFITLVPTQSGSEAKQSIETVLSLAKCERVYDLPNGLDTEIGERGIRLSGGQRQRLAIAKLMLKNPSIIILDEPTSALDSENEEAVTESLNALFAWRTVIIIAHRLQTVKTADTIVLIDNGQIAEQWTHTSLMTQKGKYFKMVELQSGF